MAPPTRRRTRATANSSPLVELKSEPKRRITKAKAKRPARAVEPEPQPAPEPEPESEQEQENIRPPQDGAAPAKASPARTSPVKTAPAVEEDRSQALELLRLADLKREQNMALSRIDVRPVELSPPAVSPVHAAPQPPSTPRTNGATPPPVTPQTSTSFLGSMWSTLKSSVWSTPKPKSARPSSNANTPVASAASTPIALPVIGDLTMTLTPTPTPVGDSRGSTKVKRTSGRRERAVIVKNVASSVPDAAEEELATKWAEKVLMQLLQDSATSTGDKRKRLEDGMTYGDLNHFNSKPWKPAASSFGLDDDLMDHVDNTPDEPAPMWAILEHLRIEQQWKGKQPESEYEASPPSAKKRKISTSTNDLLASPKQPTLPLDHARSPFYNSGGRTTSLRDLHPRSCLDRQVTSPDSNIFKQSQQTAAHQDESVPFPTSFSVPDDSDSDEDSEEELNTNGTPGASTTWTQPPPPAPVMPHAELPGSVGPTPPVPSVEGSLVASPTVAQVEAQRAKALKFTPAKPSNLSHMSKPSPSLRSDAGNESILADSPVPVFKTKASGAATPNIFQSAATTNGFSLFQNKALTNGTPVQDESSSNGTSSFQDKGLSNGTSLFQDKGLRNGTSLFQDKGLSNGMSILQDKSLSNGISIFQDKVPSNNASPSKNTGVPNGDSPFQTKDLSNGTFAVKDASTTLDFSEYDLTPPDAEPLDLPVLDWENYVRSAEHQAQLDAIDAWEDPILVYDDEL